MLICDKLTKKYGGKVALNAFSMDSGQHNSVALLGPNGAGKTTFADILIGLKKADAGTFSFRKEKIIPAIQFQNVPLFPNLSVKDNITLYRHIHGISENHDETRGLLKKWNLDDQLNSSIKTLSGGQRQSLAIILALIGSPNFIILDEPMNNLDPSARSKLRNNIKELRENSVDVLLISHDLTEVANIADYFVFMKNGENVYSGTMSDINAQFGVPSLEKVYEEIMG